MGTGETLLRSWDYAKSKGRLLTNGTYNLSVTDRRIIHTAATKKGTTVTSIKLSDVAGVSTSFSKGSILAGILMLIFGIVMTIVLAIAFMPMMVLSIVLIIIGLVICISAKTSITVSLYIKSHAETFLSANNIKFRKRAKVLNIKIDRNAAEEIASQLATLIL